MLPVKGLGFLTIWFECSNEVKSRMGCHTSSYQKASHFQLFSYNFDFVYVLTIFVYNIGGQT